MLLQDNLEDNITYLKSKMPIGKSFDIITRDMMLCGRKAYFVGINGMCRSDILEEIFACLQNPLYPENRVDCERISNRIDLVCENNSGSIESIEAFIRKKIGYIQTQICDEWEEIIKNIVSGPTVLFLDGYDKAIVIDVRTYPSRGIEEPDVEKVTRGSRDGFVETMLTNTNLIRRRIRNRQLTFEILTVGSDSKTDVAMAYVGNLVDEEFLIFVRNKITQLNITSLTMGAKSLEELLVKKRWYHPLPVIQVTERPDVACSYLMEGHLMVLVDNTPSALILPTTLFQFTQSVEDYYKSPLVGNYLRWIRFFCGMISLFLLPVFLLIGGYYPELSRQLSLAESEPMGLVRLFFYVLAVDFGLDLFRYSSAHSTSRFSGALSIVGGLLIGDMAIQLQWASIEVIFYAAMTLLATMSLPSIEFGEGIRIYRLFLILCTGILGIYGFLGGTFLILLSIVTMPSFGGKSYLWPLWPFNFTALKTLLFRYPTVKAQPSRTWKW